MDYCYCVFLFCYKNTRNISGCSKSINHENYLIICSAGVENPCARASCPWGGACVARGGAAQCACPVCDATLTPVCASDTNTYGSECKMRMHACQEGVPDGDLRVLYNGTCRE